MFAVSERLIDGPGAVVRVQRVGQADRALLHHDDAPAAERRGIHPRLDRHADRQVEPVIVRNVHVAVAAVEGEGLAEALGNEKDALDEYAFAVASSDRQAAAEAKQLEIALKQRRDAIRQADALRELETLSAVWRGSEEIVTGMPSRVDSASFCIRFCHSACCRGGGAK